MYVLIVGGGKVGFHLGRMLLGKQHEVTIVEQRPARAQLLQGLIGDVLLVGDGTLPSVLEAAGCARADIVAAVTGDDAANLLIAALAARHFGAGRTIARLNDPRNEPLFRLCGVEGMVSSSSILAELIEREVTAARVRTLLAFPNGGAAIVEVDLSPHSTAADRPVREVPWPPDSLLILILHRGDVRIPSGDTRIEAGDRLLLVAPPEAEPALQSLLAPEAP